MARPLMPAHGAVLAFDHDAILLTGQQFAAKRTRLRMVANGARAQAVKDPALAEVGADRHDFQSVEEPLMGTGQALGLLFRAGLGLNGAKLNPQRGARGRRRQGRDNRTGGL